MKQEARIVLGIFAFYLIFGLGGLSSQVGRFFSPFILDDLILLFLSIYFMLLPGSKHKYLFIGSIALFALSSFISNPQILGVFSDHINVRPFFSWVKGNANFLSKVLLFTSVFWLSILSSWSWLKRKEVYGVFKKWLILLAIYIAAGFTICLILGEGLAIFSGGLAMITGIVSARYNDECLSPVEYRYLLLAFLGNLLVVMEFVSVEGLIG